MSRIGTYEFSSSCELHVVSALGKSCPVNDAEVDLDVKCVLHCDDPYEGVYGEEIKATITGTGVVLGSEAIELLDLASEAGESFMDSGVVHPKARERYMDVRGAVWTVVESGMHHERAHDYTLLERPVGGKTRRIVVETYELVCAVEVEHEGKEVLAFRRVIGGPVPKEGEFRDPAAVYVGGPTI